jgi:hypothetical protein
MQTRTEILTEANKWQCNRALDSFIDMKYDDNLMKGNALLDDYNNKFRNSFYEEDLEIYDSYTLTSFVIIEKFADYKKMNKSSRYYMNQVNAREKYYKIIKKTKEVDGFRFVRMKVNDSNSIDIVELQRDLELKKHNVFYDGCDIDQVINYYSHIPIENF